MRSMLAGLAVALALGAGAAHAEVKSTWASGIRLENKAVVAAPPEKVWAALGQVGKWWDDAHTYSGDASNMTLPLEADACFCEKLPKGGGVRHGVVELAWPGQFLRLDAALGPLQDEGAGGALTFTLKPAPGGGTEVVQTYNVTGLRPEMIKAAPLIDQVIGGQLTRLKTYVETGKPQ